MGLNSLIFDFKHNPKLFNKKKTLCIYNPKISSQIIN